MDDIVLMHSRLGQSVEEIVAKYDLSPAQVHAAMSYYYDHKARVDQLIADDEAFVEGFKRSNPSALQARLKAISRR